MNLLARRPHWPTTWPLQPIPRSYWATQEPSYRQARPSIIESALKRAESRPSGNWYVLASSREIRAGEPFGRTVAGLELVAWRDGAGQLVVGPGACPHLGAPLASARVEQGKLVCHWHGLRICSTGGPGWRPIPSHDDGVLVWVRLDGIGDESPTPVPFHTQRPRPSSAVDAVATVLGNCEPSDVIANRLDPWHGAWFHPYSFTRLDVLDAPPEVDVDETDDRFIVAVTFRVTSRFGVPVRAEFTCPDPRTIVMRILDGEGVGSVVETHATPLTRVGAENPRTAVIEAVVADSTRRGFALAKAAAFALRPVMRRAASRLWRDDIAYAERRYELRSQNR